MNKYIVYNGHDPSTGRIDLFHRDYSEIEAHTMEEALAKISNDWVAVEGQLLFVINTNDKLARLVRVGEPPSKLTLEPVEATL